MENVMLDETKKNVKLIGEAQPKLYSHVLKCGKCGVK